MPVRFILPRFHAKKKTDGFSSFPVAQASTPVYLSPSNASALPLSSPLTEKEFCLAITGEYTFD